MTRDQRFGSFIESFHRNVRAGLADLHLSVDDDPATNLKTLQRQNQRKVIDALRDASEAALGPDIPEDRAGDGVVAFSQFVLQHGRLPSSALLFNDVLHAIKVGDEILDPLRVFVTDKEYLKIYVKAVAGDGYNVPTLGLLKHVDEVDAYPFPNQCCIKPTHASGLALLRRSGEAIDREEIKRWFTLNYYSKYREANYRLLTPKIIVEPLVFFPEPATDYKFFCFRGKAKLIQVDADRHTRHTRAFLAADGQQLPYAMTFPLPDQKPVRPGNWTDMVQLAETVSARFGFVRVDLYSNGRICHVGEITHCHEGGLGRFSPAGSETEVSRIIFES